MARRPYAIRDHYVGASPRRSRGAGGTLVFSPFTKLPFCVLCARSSGRTRSGPHIFLMWEGEQSPTEGRNPCSRPRRALILAPPRAGDRVQASPSPTEAPAENERHLDQVSARGGPGTLAPLLYGVDRCSGPQSAERGPIPPAAHALGPGRPGRARPGRGTEGARVALGKAAHSSPGSRRALEPQRRLVGSR
ncbi:hypothetical protein NDU88_001175 [Pleurodeles waltl]|uniref:Uncharacterized protein n=1 Tax=Pleurodeles waltl TaxID=8319 RepID=A0AAV7L8T0_PLEWA|nr:hypothetical protein NDU88_001175 [Pleurodeles waltl]